MPEDPLRPHELLAVYYPSHEARPAFVRALFNRTAGEYDRINRLFSLGSGGWYRRRALRRAGVGHGASVLDVATGTGLVAREAVRLVGDTHRVIGLDLSEKMLARARTALGIAVIQGHAEALPIADRSLDFVTMGYALRHMCNLRAAFAEFRRVLHPGGSVVILEIGRPSEPCAAALARLYLGRIVPALCRTLIPRSAAGTLMRYHWDTIEACVPPPIILGGLADAGLEAPACRIDLGLFRAYTARRPAH